MSRPIDLLLCWYQEAGLALGERCNVVLHVEMEDSGRYRSILVLLHAFLDPYCSPRSREP